MIAADSAVDVVAIVVAVVEDGHLAGRLSLLSLL